MEQNEKKKSAFGPDDETLHRTDPQENMRGPFSSAANGVRHDVDVHGGEHDPSRNTQQKMDGDRNAPHQRDRG